MAPSAEDQALITELLGRVPQGRYEIVVRHDDGVPRVIRNAPILDDGTPMPTLYWLVSPEDRVLIGRLESAGGVDRAEAEIGLERIAEAHEAYRAERDALLPLDWGGPRPSAGVGGTRVGVKCLHAHYAAWLAKGTDPVGAWVSERLAAGEGEKHVAHPPQAQQ